MLLSKCSIFQKKLSEEINHIKVCLTWRGDLDVVRIRVVSSCWCEHPILAPELGPHSAHVLSLVLSPDRLQDEAVVSDSLPGGLELAPIRSGAVLGPHSQNTGGADAGQLNTTPQPGHGEELLL